MELYLNIKYENYIIRIIKKMVLNQFKYKFR